MAEFAAPPSYDDVVPRGSVPAVDPYQPSAPPPGDFGSAEPIVYHGDAQTTTDTGDQRRQSEQARRQSEQARRQSEQSRRQSGQSSNLERFINRYISYSIAHHLRKYIEPKTDQQDPELDVEAHFARHVVRSTQMAIEKKRRLQCISGWLWCIAVILAIMYVALPVAMVVIGVVGIGQCPHRLNTIVAYLIGGGLILGILVSIRIIPSIMTCIRNRNYCSTGNSDSYGGCICALETIFYIVLVINFIALVLGTYTTFAEGKPVSCSASPSSAPDCCDPFVYISSATFAVFQYVLYSFTGLFVCLVLSCIRSMDKQTGV